MQQVFVLLVIQALACSLLLGAMYGWGAIARKFVWPNLETGFLPAMGLVAMVVLGGPFVWAGVASTYLLTSFLVIGLIVLLIQAYASRNEISDCLAHLYQPMVWLKLVALVAVFTPLYASSLGGFDENADKVGYVVHVARLAQGGSYGPDPFNSRLIESSLGGFNVLLGFANSAGVEFYQLRVVERFFAPLLCLLTVCAFASRLRATETQLTVTAGLCMVTMYLAIGFGETGTLTGVVSAIPVYLLFVRWLQNDVFDFRWRNLIAAGAIVSVICVMKTTHIVTLGLFAPVAVLMIPRWPKGDRIKAGFFTCVVAVALLVPYMHNMHSSSGTWLYPFLGKGFHGSSYGIYYKPNLIENLAQTKVWRGMAGAASRFMPLLLLGLTYAIYKRKLNVKEGLQPWALSLSLISLGVGGLVLVAATGFSRYAYTSFAVASFLMILELPSISTLFRRFRRPTSWVICACLAAVYFLPLMTGIRRAFRDSKQGIEREGTMLEPISAQAVAVAQAVVPEGELILARMGQAYFLDFARNPIWHLDIPGSACPPPGLPFGREASSQDLAAYLKNVGVRYLIYSEPDNGGHLVDKFVGRQDPAKEGLWMAQISENIIETDRLIHGLERSGVAVAYRQNGLVVFDLTTSRQTPLETMRGNQ